MASTVHWPTDNLGGAGGIQERVRCARNVGLIVIVDKASEWVNNRERRKREVDDGNRWLWLVGGFRAGGGILRLTAFLIEKFLRI